MSKKILRTINEASIEGVNQKIEDIKKNGCFHREVKSLGVRVGKLLQSDGKQLQEAEKSGNTQIAIELMDKVLATNVSELYFNLPDLHISDIGSIKSVAVSVYSAEANDNTLLHKIFTRIREEKQPRK
ncbi:hypothetical protein A3E17_00760 [Candidatus Amesbacteria bacterium RIFCSPHIGHO2_12_FULL_48_14]|uniref:Uncharacterized protein n=2 Tax=Microgenomates group TaxID=1794810 RepID=A0A1F4Z4N9_9BACT|nr:MAG: hypothetical protein A3E17_00760 [Candidatus Amesbacteria bacterium RIFCSPHIGHO2_12_FULL_48_14]OGY30317.1 MAG: hypothetical protein A3J50_00470 [Candidatus Woykebacteria bacterium RIFCSPHIGHO2_02_FULL_43_16b]